MATSKATRPTLRAEAWLTRPDALNLGIVALPVVLHFRGTVPNPLAYRGQNFVAGEPGRLRYQFNSVRFIANHDVRPGEATAGRASRGRTGPSCSSPSGERMSARPAPGWDWPSCTK
jgi:hypothetical protein